MTPHPEVFQEWLQEVGITNLLVGLEPLFSDVALFVVDASQNIIFWNTHAQELLGYTPEDAVGFHCRKVIRCMECMMGCPLQEQKALKRFPRSLYHAGGQAMEFHTRGVAFYGAQQQFLGGIECLYRPLKVEQAKEALSLIAHHVEQERTESSHEVTVSQEVFSTQEAEVVEVPPTQARQVPNHTFPQHLFEDTQFESFDAMLSRDAKMKKVFRIIENIAKTEATVLIHGESGTGKELVARAIHRNSERAKQPFVAINCAALSPTLLESELFGHVKGAFTGAVAKRVGLFQQADKGTIFLDEIAEVPLALQSKLLRVLEEKEVIPVGSNTPIKVDIRIVSASFQSLQDKVAQGQFREDLMYRLRVVPIELPPLRERKEDVELLIWHFVQNFNERHGHYIEEIESDAMIALIGYKWPGNIRELKNTMEYAFAVGRNTVLKVDALPDYLFYQPKASKKKAKAKGTSEEEKELIRSALEDSHGHVGQAAETLGMSRATLWRKRKRYGI
tara:strand:- start:1473 stop:2987 length:1515 start_codon:yes stop_codon:yes gene_type:complete